MTTNEIIATAITTLGTTSLGIFVTNLMTRSKMRIEVEKTAAEIKKMDSERRLNEADNLTNKYSQLYSKLEDYNKQLEAQNDKLEQEIERSKLQEAVCQKRLAENTEKIVAQEKRISQLEELVKEIKK